MGKRTRDIALVQEERDRILNEALKLLETGGMEALSMRKLAAKCGFTATTIYNYFLNKDELYLTILVVGFSKLYESLEKSAEPFADPYDKLRAGINEYIRFGFEEAGYYNIMFTYDFPKYTTYFGKREEAIAMDERMQALNVLNFFQTIIKEIARCNPGLQKENLGGFMMELWCMLHGYISLCNSQVMQTVEEDMPTAQANLVERIMSFFKP